MNTDPNVEVFSRAVSFDLEEGDGRTLEARIVPYNVTATVADPPHMIPYKERFAPGAFKGQMKAANRIDVLPGDAAGILLNFDHGQRISDVVGRGTELEDRADGLHAKFRILDHPDGDKALELIRAGVLRGMSAEFRARRSRSVDGVIERIDARVGNVALCRDFGSPYVGPKAAYAGAEILAVRHQDGQDDEEQEEREVIVLPPLLPPVFDRLAKYGVQEPRWAVRKDQ